ncbi:hypothetical protein E4T56_gene16422 [Termitomyces sp. T112]|nr:hypothetical protein E4T56_gene16422 [Termitomyces sp. T112]
MYRALLHLPKARATETRRWLSLNLLRDKLHHLSSTLAETQNYVRELEDARRESREQVKSFLEKVEKEADERVEVAKKRMEEMEGEFKTLRECRDVSSQYYDRRPWCCSLRTHRTGKSGRRSAPSFRQADEKQRSEAAAHAKRLDAAKKATEKVQDSRRQTEVQIAAGLDDVSLIRDADDILLKLLQGRFYPQAMMLRLTKEQYGDIQLCRFCIHYSFFIMIFVIEAIHSVRSCAALSFSSSPPSNPRPSFLA